MNKPDDPNYVKWYEKGWRYSGTEAASLDFVPHGVSVFSPEYDNWLDGYLDRAASREKWHLFHCQNHHNNEGGCGQA